VPSGVDDLEGHRMVGFRSSAIGAVLPLEFTIGREVREVMLPCALTVSGAETYAAAAMSGFGLIQAPHYRFERELASVALQIVLPEHPPTPLPISVLYPRAKHLSPRVRVFIDWLTEVFEGVRRLPDRLFMWVNSDVRKRIIIRKVGTTHLLTSRRAHPVADQGEQTCPVSTSPLSPP
jgi:hypothetical protein